MSSVTQIELGLGIQKHKASTFAEAEMLALAGAKDVFLSYNLVGPNIDRAVKFRLKYPHVEFAAAADFPAAIEKLGAAMTAAGTHISLLLDINPGFVRTGVDPAGLQALDLYRMFTETPGIIPGGLHVYDGNHHQFDFQERTDAVHAMFAKVQSLKDKLLARGWAVPKIVCGGTGSFPVYCKMNEPLLELSPGTTVLNDLGYTEAFPDLAFEHAAFVLTRVISRPTPDRVTFDMGHKAISPDQPVGNRFIFPELPDARQVLHNEEHLAVETSRAAEFSPGDVLWALPRHICPTTSLYDWAYVVENGAASTRWDITARGRQITI